VSAEPATAQVHLLSPGDPRTAAALDVMADLRDHIDRNELEARYRAACAEGYQLAALFTGAACVAVAGFRISTNLHLGRNCYVDDLVTASSVRSQGHGRMLHRWLVDHATAAGCTTLHLDSNTQRKRAHRFYLLERHEIVAFHFSRPLMPGGVTPST
jgi:GNAT superfamily N-acetyltransferase